VLGQLSGKLARERLIEEDAHIPSGFPAQSREPRRPAHA
jgi:hypothetical protein